MVEKRSAEAADGVVYEDPAKRLRTDNGATAAPAGPGALPAKPALSLEALEKAKRALQLQKELQEKLKNKLPQLAAKLPAAAPAAAAPAAVPLAPPPTRPPTSVPFAAPPTLAPPTAPPPSAIALQQQQQQLQPPKPKVDASEFYDPRMGRGAGKRRPRTDFEFVQEGRLQKEAEMVRLRSKFGDDVFKRRGTGGLPSLPLVGPSMDPNLVPIGGDPNLVPLGTPARSASAEPPEVVPDVEPWDKGLLVHGSYDDKAEDGETFLLKENKITHYVEHPVPIEPPAEEPPPPPQPLKLTKKELKKLRTQRRQAREKEKQELIRQGLLEPPKPKVRIANLHRVLGEQAAADPTAIEQEVRKQMAERQAAHDDRNLARMLTPAERREKKMKKLFDDTGLEITTSVYKVARITNPSQRFKIDINAKENKMTGCLALTPAFCLVVVEGCPKSTKRYMKLMLRRIDWNQLPDNEDEIELDLPPNTCDLIWQGIVQQTAFEDFRVERFQTVEAAQKFFQDKRVAHYWDVAAAHVPGESLPVTL